MKFKISKKHLPNASFFVSKNFALRAFSRVPLLINPARKAGFYFVLFTANPPFYFSSIMAIDLKECLSIMQSGVWFSIRFITADINKGSGGKVLEFPRARIARNSLPGSKPFIKDTEIEREPNHHLNFTRNLQLPNNQIRKVHPILITHINQQPVV